MSEHDELSKRLAETIGVTEIELDSMAEAAKIAAAHYRPMLIEAARSIKEASLRSDTLEAEVERWRNNFDNAQMQITDLVAEVERLKEVLRCGVGMAAAMNMTAGWVDSAKQILGGRP